MWGLFGMYNKSEIRTIEMRGDDKQRKKERGVEERDVSGKIIGRWRE